MFRRMAKQRKTPKLIHCKVVFTTHPSAPWRVSYPTEVDGVTRRKRRMFSTEEKALDFAVAHERDVSDYGVRFGSITGEARRAFDHYRDARAELTADGIEIPSFEALVTTAVASLRREHEQRQRLTMTVAEAVEAFRAYKEARVGERRREDLKGQLRRFALHFGDRRFDSISGTEIETWISSLQVLRSGESASRAVIGPATRNKIRKMLKSFFSYGCAAGQSWSGHNPLADIEPERMVTKIPKAYSVEQTNAILDAALRMNSPALPELALGFFSGLRPTEIMALDLEAIDFDADEFRTPMHHANGEPTKTGTRMAPLTPACKAWLLAQPRRKGRACLCDATGLSTEMRGILTAAGVKGISDGRRHSFISYRCAEIRDVARVADECGNSPNVIKTNYRDMVTAAAAARYFAIRPEAEVGNVTDIEEGRASA